METPQTRGTGHSLEESGGTLFTPPLFAEDEPEPKTGDPPVEEPEKGDSQVAPAEESPSKTQETPAVDPPRLEEEQEARGQAAPRESPPKLPEPTAEEPSNGEGAGTGENSRSPRVILTPHSQEEEREPQESPPSGPRRPSKSPSPVRRRGDKGLEDSSPEETGSAGSMRRLTKPLLKPLELVGPKRLEERVASLVKQRQEAKEA